MLPPVLRLFILEFLILAKFLKNKVGARVGVKRYFESLPTPRPPINFRLLGYYKDFVVLRISPAKNLHIFE